MANKNARRLRSNLTDAEKKLWHYLRKKQLGYRFRRQHPMHPYVVDFVCLEEKLIIEIDGSQHLESDIQIYDKARSQFFENKGFVILRFWNNDIFENLEGVIETILLTLPQK